MSKLLILVIKIFVLLEFLTSPYEQYAIHIVTKNFEYLHETNLSWKKIMLVLSSNFDGTDFSDRLKNKRWLLVFTDVYCYIMARTSYISMR